MAWPPALRVSHYRTLFYGYDSVVYWLNARKSPAVIVQYKMSIKIGLGRVRSVFTEKMKKNYN
jgi:hypothetical protein